MKRPGARWKHTTTGDEVLQLRALPGPRRVGVGAEEVLQLRALQLSDRWAPAVQRAIRPLAKPVQIAAGLYAAKLTKTAPITAVHGARTAA